MKKYFNVIDKKMNDKNILKSCSDFLYQKNAVTKKFSKEVLKRAKIASLYMGNGLVLPHPTEEGRKEIVGEGAVLLTWFKEPAVYEGNAIHFAVSLAVPGDGYMDVMAKVAEKFVDEKAILELVNRNDENFIKSELGW